MTTTTSKCRQCKQLKWVMNDGLCVTCALREGSSAVSGSLPLRTAKMTTTEPDWAEAADRLRIIIRRHLPGLCRIPSQGDNCRCPLCDVDRLIIAIRDIRERTIEEAAEIAGRYWHTGGTICEDRDNCGIIIHNFSQPEAVAKRIRALNPSEKVEG